MLVLVGANVCLFTLGVVFHLGVCDYTPGRGKIVLRK